MTGFLTLTLPLALATGAAAGLALGLLYFAAMWLAVRLHVSGGGGRAIALHAARLGIAGGGLWLLAQLGAAALIGGLFGLLAARQIAVHTIRSGRW